MKREERVIMVKFVRLGFGDWGENFIGKGEWSNWSDWNGVKDVMDKWMEENDYKIDWRELCESVEINSWGNYVKELCREEYDEESELVFNIEEMGEKVIKLGDNGEYFILEDNGKIDWISGEVNGEISRDVEYIVLMDEGMKYFKLVRK